MVTQLKFETADEFASGPRRSARHDDHLRHIFRSVIVKDSLVDGQHMQMSQFHGAQTSADPSNEAAIPWHMAGRYTF